MNTTLPRPSTPCHRLTGRRCIAAGLLSLACAAQAQVGLTRLDLAGLPLTLVCATEARAGFDARLRSQAQARIADVHRQHLDPH